MTTEMIIGKSWVVFEALYKVSLRYSAPVCYLQNSCCFPCYAGKLTTLDFARAPKRILKLASGGSQTIDFILAKSLVSTSKKKRILHLVNARDDFSKLANSSWDNLDIRGSLCLEASSTHDLTENCLSGENSALEEYEAAWALLQAMAMGTKYLGRTEYNPFTLLKLGDRFSKDDPVSFVKFPLRRVIVLKLSGTMGNIS